MEKVVAYGELNALTEKLAGDLGRDISLISVKLAKQLTRHPWNRNTVVHIARRYLEGEHFSELIDDKVKLEAISKQALVITGLKALIKIVNRAKQGCEVYLH